MNTDRSRSRNGLPAIETCIEIGCFCNGDWERSEWKVPRFGSCVPDTSSVHDL